jgi:hypothetical protein
MNTNEDQDFDDEEKDSDGDEDHYDNDNETHVLTMSYLQGAFRLWLLGLGVALVVHL